MGGSPVLFCGGVLAPDVAIFSFAFDRNMTIGPLIGQVEDRAAHELYIFGHRLVERRPSLGPPYVRCMFDESAVPAT